jgi:hypothetical protein
MCAVFSLNEVGFWDIVYRHCPRIAAKKGNWDCSVAVAQCARRACCAEAYLLLQLLLFADDSLDCTAFFAEDYRHQSIAQRIVNEHERSNACTALETRRFSFHRATPYPHMIITHFYKRAEKSCFFLEVEVQLDKSMFNMRHTSES